MDVLLPTGGGGAFIGARVKGAVGSGIGMDGVFFAVNDSTWVMALGLPALGGGNATSSGNVLASGPVPDPSSSSGSASSWRRLSLSVVGVTAGAILDGVLVAQAVPIPKPHDHYTAKVAGVVVDLGSGGYASFGTVGYASVEFDNLSILSSD